jgi:MFS family permease
MFLQTTNKQLTDSCVGEKSAIKIESSFARMFGAVRVPLNRLPEWLKVERMDVQRTEVLSPPVAESFPVGLHNAFLFSMFNALSFQLVLGSPMVLYAKTLGASATVLGIIAGMMPLLVIFQIPAASYLPQFGFKQFVYAGWGIRVMFIFAIAFVPLTGSFLNASNRLALILVLLFCFNLSRGISSCAWLPWITVLVPASLRGKYLARDAAVQNLGSYMTFLMAAVCLLGPTQPWQFAILFCFSAIMGVVSLSFLKRIPDAEMSEERVSKGRVPWLEMAAFPPFKKLLIAVVGWSVAYGGLAAFSVAYLKAAGMSESRILLVTSISFLGGLSSLWILGARLDRLGSKPVLTFSFVAWVAVLMGWILLAGGLFALKLSLILLLQFFMGLLAALVQMSNTRLAMAVIPAMGRNHFFAIYSVVGNVTLGLAPVGWGLLIDAVGRRSHYWLGLDWNRFTIFFAATTAVYIGTLYFIRKLDEPEAASMEVLLKEILIHSPQRFLVRFWPRG